MSSLPPPDPDKILDEPFHESSSLEPRIRKYGYFPDIRQWRPGDLLLTAPLIPSKTEMMVTKAARHGYNASAIRWTHASIYIGQGYLLCEADYDEETRSGSVRVENLHSYIGKFQLLLKRSNVAKDDPEIGFRIAIGAMTKLGSQYDAEYVVREYKRFLADPENFWFKEYIEAMGPKGFTCATLFSEAHELATGMRVRDTRNKICSPAFLALKGNPQLHEVPIFWQRIAEQE